MTYFVSDWLTLSYFHSVSSRVYLLLFILILFDLHSWLSGGFFVYLEYDNIKFPKI